LGPPPRLVYHAADAGATPAHLLIAAMSRLLSPVAVSAALALVCAPAVMARRQAAPPRAAAAAQPAAVPADPARQAGPAAPAPTGRLDAPLPGAFSPRNANYSIEVRLEPQTRTLTGRQVLTWRNISARPATELQFHLYYNAWRNTRSTWMRERLLASGPDPASRRAGEWGWIDVTGIRLLGAGAAPPIDLTEQQRFIAPDDGNLDDRTVMAVPLPQAVEPGATVNVELSWTSHVPRTFARTGAIDNFFFIAQWFPKIGVLEDAGWNCHQFHSATEFYADYGVYDVRITVPTGWVLGATGLERERRENTNATTTYRYYQEDVHDFAWTTSPSMVERREVFEHPTLPRVDMRLLLQPEHAGQADRHFAATRAALRHYGEWYGPYPYGHITIVDPAWQSGAGGMEYPTLFTAGTRWLAPARVMQPESVTVHEAGHQFWYGIVGNNEFEDAWLDEGLNTFSTARTLEQAFEHNALAQRFFGGFIPWVHADIRLSRATDGNRLSGYRAAARADAQATPTFRYWPATASAITYNKTALWLHTLERHLGWPTLQRIMATFFERWKFRHPKPQDFFAIVNEVTREDYSWFFDQVYRGSNVFDYGIQALTSGPATARGYFERDGALAFDPRTDPQGRFRTTVVARRYGEGIFPVEILVVFQNGEQVREQWDGVDRWRLFTYDRPARAQYAQVDPERVLLLDVNYTNNSRTLTPSADGAATKWTLKWLVWLQDLMATWAFFV
jgi:hypothetical protein